MDAPRASPAAAAAALASFVAAVDARDVDALASLAPEADADAEDVLGGIARNAESLDLRGVSARYVDQVGAVGADGSWTGEAELTWQLGGFDPAASRADVLVSFSPDGDGLGIAGFAGTGATGGTRVPLWLRGELSVSRAEGVLVLVDGDPSDAASVEQRVTRGIQVVRRVLPAWSSPVVVEVPASGSDLDETLGVEPGTYADIAAVTTTAGSSTADDAPVHVFVNPDVTAGLRRAGAQVVMTHELVHVATNAARTPMEPWLLEGFADYVALRDMNLPDRVKLGLAIELVRRDGVPDAFPAAADFDTRAANLQASYELAWLACRIIAERLGEQTLVSVYDQAANHNASIDAALRHHGVSRSAITRDWRRSLDEVAD